MSHQRLLMSMIVLVVIVLLVTVSAVTAQAPSTPGSTLPYTGRLMDPSGQPVADGRYDFIFTLYASEGDDQALWSEMQSGLDVRSGNLNVTLGQSTRIPKELAERKELWLSVSVRGPNDQDFTLLNPRQRFSAPASPSALTCPHSHFTDYWPGTSPGYGLIVENTSTGDAVRAYSSSTTNGYAAIWAINTAPTGYGTAVYANSNTGLGVYAYSNAGDAIEATTNAATKSAVYAHVANGYGVTGRSTGNFGVQAGGGGDTSYSDPIGDLYLEGTRGELFTGGDVLEFYSNGFIVFDLDENNNGNNQLEVWNGAESLVFKVDENGNTTATGTKSAKVHTANYGDRLLYAMESPEVWIEDFGSAKLVDGMTIVNIESIFAETASLNADYHIFLTPLGDCALYVAEKTPASFTVKAIGEQKCSIAFDYRIVAKRSGYETERLAPVDLSDNSRSGEVK